MEALMDRLLPERLWHRVVVAILLGTLMTLGHAPVDFPWIFFLAVPWLALLLDRARNWRQAAWIGWGSGFGYFVSGLHWIGHAFLVDAEKFAWLLPFAVTLLPAFLALFWAGAMALYYLVRPSDAPGLRLTVLRVLLLAATLTTAELARGHVLTGFPWALPAYIWTETPLLQTASLIGPYGLSFATLVLTGLPALLGLQRRWPAMTLALAGFAALWLWGSWRVPAETAYAPDAPVIRVVQPNAPQNLKWRADYAPLFYRRLLDHSSAPADPELGPPDAVIWPETAVTFLPADYPDERRRIAEAAAGATVIAGAFDRQTDAEGERLWYNALVTIRPDGSMGETYAKHHLVPFGEYMPFKSVMSAIGLRQLSEHGGMSPGPGPRKLAIDGLPEFAVAICYEMIFPEEIVGAGRPEWLLTVTNDAWFGGFAGPQQHLAQARFRAVEQGLPVVRSANTGISAVIDPHGRVLWSIGLHKDGFGDIRLPDALSLTLYTKTYNLSILLAILLSLSLALAWRTLKAV